MRATKASVVQLEVSEEIAGLLRELVYMLDWDEFEFAQGFVDALDKLEVPTETSLVWDDARQEIVSR